MGDSGSLILLKQSMVVNIVQDYKNIRSGGLERI